MIIARISKKSLDFTHKIFTFEQDYIKTLENYNNLSISHPLDLKFQ